MNEIIDIVSRYKKVYFISPHLDDAVLSSGELLSILKNKAIVVNVFTSPNEYSSTLSAKMMILKGKSINQKSFYNRRVVEDHLAIKALGVNKVINLNFVDALWRLNPNTGLIKKLLGYLIPELIHIYPTYKYHIKPGKISPKDKELEKTVAEKLNKIIDKDSLVICPVGVGNHIDHLIVRNACKHFKNLVYWQDYPYSRDSIADEKFLQDNNLTSTKLITNNDTKTAKLLAIEKYTNQLSLLFKKGNVKVNNEVYFVSDIKKSAPTISIGIPALNEESNIKHLLEDIYDSKFTCGDLKEVIIFSDGSTDNTNKIIKDFAKKFKKIKPIFSPKRLGLKRAQNHMFKLSNSDIFISLNADISIPDRMTLNTLIKPILIGGYDMTSGAIIPVGPKTLVEKILYSSVIFKEKLFNLMDNKDSVFTCHGPLRAYSKRLYKKIKFQFDTGEDAYSYFYTTTSGYTYKYVKTSFVYYRLPNNISDHFNQSRRFYGMTDRLTAHFNKKLVLKELSVRPKDIIKTVLLNPLFMFKNITFLILYLFLNVCCQITTHFYKSTQTDPWVGANSTKKL